MLPEKLQIVKPIEGSQTLQHWQYLATPTLGCLFEERPGIRVKGNYDDRRLKINNSNSNLQVGVNKKDSGLSFNPNDTDEGKLSIKIHILIYSLNNYKKKII